MSSFVHEEDGSVIELDDVEVTFGQDGFLDRLFSNDQLVSAVDGVSLEIPENDVVALVGESGCGKTTLGKTAIGLQRPSGGSVSFRGQDVWEAKERRGLLSNDDDLEYPFSEIRQSLQIIHQDPGSSLNPNRTIEASLNEPLRKHHSSRNYNERREYILDMLETVGMDPAEDYAKRYPHQLSGGEKQRVALVRALMVNPDLILADEAISALDVSLRIEMMDLMLELQEEFDTSFLFISHDLSNARYFAGKADGRLGVMYLGELVEIGPVEEVVQNPKHPYTKVLSWAAADIHPDQNREEEQPIREIDIPDPADPPEGCRFHTRCPEAREACKQSKPDLYETDDERHVSCFRELDNHEYWSSPSLVDDE